MRRWPASCNATSPTSAHVPGAVVLLVFIVNENLQPGSTVQNLLMKVLLVLVAVSVLYSALLCFVPETGWYSDVYPWAYRDIIEPRSLDIDPYPYLYPYPHPFDPREESPWNSSSPRAPRI